jgi:hypothetical protein
MELGWECFLLLLLTVGSDVSDFQLTSVPRLVGPLLLLLPHPMHMGMVEHLVPQLYAQ